jgi:chromatin remodeling complex protein RSC6
MATAKKSAAGAKKAGAKKTAAKGAVKGGAKPAVKGGAAKKAAAKGGAAKPAAKGAAKGGAAKSAAKGGAAKVASKGAAKPAARGASKGGAAKSGRAPNPAFMKPMQPSDALGAVVGTSPMPRSEITSRVWDYIKRNGLQDQQNRRQINADDKLRPVFGGKSSVSMFEMTKLVNNHLRDS